MKIFYLHGMGGGVADWQRVASLCPGEALEVPDSETFDAAADVIRSRLEQEAKPFLLCGYSLGGRLAIRVASRFKGPTLRGLVLLAAGLGISGQPEREARKIADLRWAELLRGSPEEFWRKWYQQDIFHTFARLPEHLKSPWLEARLSLNSANLASQILSLSPASHEPLKPELLRIKKDGLPVIFMAGEEDAKYRSLGLELEACGIEYREVPGGHILPLESPQRVASALKDFISAIEKRK